MGKTWDPPEKTKEYIRNSWLEIRGYKPGDLLDMCTFERVGVITDLLGMGGITFSKDKIVLGKNVTKVWDYTQHYKFQAVVIFHELDHVAQQKDWGWFGFMMTYLWEWIRAGFNYDRMKKKGIEKEAFDLEVRFAREINYRHPDYDNVHVGD